jgi:hypothetical protein
MITELRADRKQLQPHEDRSESILDRYRNRDSSGYGNGGTLWWTHLDVAQLLFGQGQRGVSNERM